MNGLNLVVDAAHGGRWTSLRDGDGKEWLRRRDAPERDDVRPGDAFVDAGGLEECFPTLGGVPDHGDVWTRAWVLEGDGLTVRSDWYDLHRTIGVGDDQVTATYRLRGEPGRGFIWAAHPSLDLSDTARLVVPDGHAVTAYSDQGSRTGSWPMVHNTDVSTLGPADGTVTELRLRNLASATVIDGGSRFTMTIEVVSQPFGFLIWRNLGGWPEEDPYRSIVVEPMIGHRATLAHAAPSEAGVVPPEGELTWVLRVRVGRHDG